MPDETGQGLLPKLYLRNLPPDQPPYQVDKEVYQRFDQRNNLTVGRPNWDEEIMRFTRKTGQTKARRILENKPGFHLPDYALFGASGVLAESLGSKINHTNRGVTTWASLGAKLPEGVKRWEGSPEEATAMIKRVAHFFGADLVGVVPLDRRWMFSHAVWMDGAHKEIVFKNVESPTETGEQLVIPEKMGWVIVMGTRMDSETIKYAPSPVGCAGTHIVYSQMALQVAGLAEFLRGLGYNAIPSLNDLALNIPLAIDAGFGEQGRNGKLITPTFGPSVRLCKVFTNLPMVRDHPIRFGVKEFCMVCLKCAETCPSKSIPTGEPTWSGPSISNNPGVYTWHLDNDSCRRYWAMGVADNCTVCIRSCPFTKRPGWVHELTRTAISNIPVLDPLWRKMDDILGYGRDQVAARFWK